MKYKVYYLFNGPSKSNPLAVEKTAEEIEAALENFPKELDVNLRPAGKVTVTSVDTESSSLIVEVESDMPQDKLDEVLARNLSEWNLFATKLPT